MMEDLAKLTKEEEKSLCLPKRFGIGFYQSSDEDT